MGETTGLVLSIFPGIDNLGNGFEDAGWCVVKGGEPMFGQRGIESFHPPVGAFEGVVGGPPCQMWAQSHNLSGDKDQQVNLIPEFERVVREAQPWWFLMENVMGAPLPQVAGYSVQSHKLFAWEVGNPQRRKRRFSFGSRLDKPLLLQWPQGAKPPKGQLTLLAKHNGAKTKGQRKRSLTLPMCEYEDGHSNNIYTLTGSPRVHSNSNGRKVMPTLCATNSTQRMRSGERAYRNPESGKTTFTLDEYRYGFGMPPDWDAEALLKAYKFKVLGNSVPMEVSRALALAVRRAVERG